MAGFDYSVTEITVSGSFKQWEDPRSKSDGTSGGTEVSMTVVPADPDQSLWSPQEASIVALDVRMQIHILLLADAQKRGVQIPVPAKNAVIQYREEVKRLKENHSKTDWKDKDVPPPKPNPFYDHRVEDPTTISPIDPATL